MCKQLLALVLLVNTSVLWAISAAVLGFLLGMPTLVAAAKKQYTHFALDQMWREEVLNVRCA